jgi:hypothetical protein
MHPKLRALIGTMINPVPPPECRATDAPAATPTHPTTCSTCRFWQVWGKDQQHLSKAINGSCHRRAPQLFLIDGQTRTKWPATYATDGCGDHRFATRPPG